MKRLTQLDAEKNKIFAKVSDTEKNSDARKYALLKWASANKAAHDVLMQAWAMGQKEKPRAFEGYAIKSPSFQ